MNRITNAVLSFFELVEAEGRELRAQTEIMAKRVLLLFFGGLLLFAAALAGGFAFLRRRRAEARPSCGRAARTRDLVSPGLYALSKGLAKERGSAPAPRSEGDDANAG